METFEKIIEQYTQSEVCMGELLANISADGMMMGCGCGIVFLISFLINVLENLGVFPQSITFLPFFSAGGSCIIISYGLMGIVLSTYRYKNIYPRHPETGFMSINSKVKKAS